MEAEQEDNEGKARKEEPGMAYKVIYAILKLAIAFGFVCLGVLLFSMQFGFDWSFLLCVCVYIGIIAIRATLKD